MAGTVIAVGAKAPDFTLKDQYEKEASPSEYAGKKVVLSFHPLAWTSLCTQQMQDLEKHRADLAARGAVALGLSVDSVPCKTAWAKAIGVSETRILADFWPQGGVAASLGVFRERNGFSERAVIIVDAGGKVAWTKIHPIPELPDMEEILAALESVRS